MKIGDALNSINVTKKNLIRDSGAPDVAEKLYVPFLTARSLSYHADCIMFVNEINTRGRAEHAVSNGMHYEFLLHAIEKRKRFASWQKPTKDDDIYLIMREYKYSHEKARDVVDLFSEEDLEALRRKANTGGVQTKKK